MKCLNHLCGNRLSVRLFTWSYESPGSCEEVDTFEAPTPLLPSPLPTPPGRLRRMRLFKYPAPLPGSCCSEYRAHSAAIRRVCWSAGDTHLLRYGNEEGGNFVYNIAKKTCCTRGTIRVLCLFRYFTVPFSGASRLRNYQHQPLYLLGSHSNIVVFYDTLSGHGICPPGISCAFITLYFDISFKYNIPRMSTDSLKGFA